MAEERHNDQENECVIQSECEERPNRGAEPASGAGGAQSTQEEGKLARDQRSQREVIRKQHLPFRLPHQLKGKLRSRRQAQDLLSREQSPSAQACLTSQAEAAK